jgi:LuxR family maltose regulon positive regulatory protein
MEHAPGQPAVAEIPLIATKHYAPRWRADLVSRPRLVERLNRGVERKLTLVSAPAGFGKTTLLAEWLATRPEQSIAWVSLDRADNDPVRFWTYLINGLHAIRPEIGTQVLARLRSVQAPPVDSVLTILINELAALTDDIVLVLDDLHVIEHAPIHEAIAFLVEHLPPRLHLIVTTRVDPPLPLARLRGRGNLTEVRAADLRFTGGEAAVFLNDLMRLDLSAADIAALDGRTEGWIAGLQLAALSMRDHHDTAGFIRTFAGDHRHVVDYLVEEVLHQQPDDIRRFLLQTSILDRLNGPLCDAVTGQQGSAGRLETLERGNFFLVPLDDQRRWYRYHHLFADVLLMHLQTELPGEVPALHRRASRWYDRNGTAADAIRHALLGGDAEHAAGLIERAVPAMRQRRQEATLRDWFQALPESVLSCRPVLNNVYAGVLLQCGEIEGVDARLREAERWAEAIDGASGQAPPGMVSADETQLRHLPGLIAVHRAGLSLALGDIAGTVANARRAIPRLAPDDLLGRGAASALLGLAAWTTGDLEVAYQSFAEGMANIQRAGYIVDAIGGVLALADIRIAQGRLRDAERVYEGALRLAAEQGAPEPRGTADMHVGLSELCLERGDIDGATRHLQRSAELGELAGFPQFPYRRCVAMARLREIQGDLDAALGLLDEAEHRYAGDMYPNVRPVAALKARVQIARGRLDEASAWARTQGLSPEDDPNYLRELAHIALARLLLAQAAGSQRNRALAQARQLLERLLEAAVAGGRSGSEIEILILLALARQMEGAVSAALAALERALTLAEPEGYLRIFVSEGTAMRDLLRQAATGSAASGYAQRLARAFDDPDLIPAPQAPAPGLDLVEPLTARQIEILRLIATGMRNQEIAEQLYLSLPTVKRHIANIYGKLGVDHRTEAVAKANELHLL